MNSLLANLDLTKILAVVYYHKLIMKDCYQASRKAKPCPSNILMGKKKRSSTKTFFRDSKCGFNYYCCDLPFSTEEALEIHVTCNDESKVTHSKIQPPRYY
jgi:hypothetical protein